MNNLNIVVLPGDGIGPEVSEYAVKVVNMLAEHAGLSLELDYADFGGISLDRHGVPATEDALTRARSADAVLLGAVGGPKWDDLPSDKRPERGLLQLRSGLEAYCNLRPAKLYAPLAEACPLKAERAGNFDFVVVRELTGGIYFGEPREITGEPGARRGVNSLVYEEEEIRRIARIGFELAAARNGKLCSVDKANVLEVMALWRSVVCELAEEYPGVELSHLYVDNCAMQLVLNPCQFDVIVTGNMFGDIISDEAAAITGSIGMLPSASVGDHSAIYEPIHGSAPDIAGKGLANPLAAILSAGMLFEHTAKRPDLSQIVESAVSATLAMGLRTADLAGSGDGIKRVGTEEMGVSVLEQIRKQIS